MKPHLFSRLTNPAELDAAFSDVLAHYPKSATPKPLQDFDRHRGREIHQLARELHSHQFLPQPAALIHIPKPNKPGESREIGLLSPHDRIVLTLLNRILTPILDHHFPPHVFSYRRGRSAAQSIHQASAAIAAGNSHAATGDIDDFFPSIHRPTLLDDLKQHIWEQAIIDLVETYLHIGSAPIYGGPQGPVDWSDTGLGIAQGSPLSPLLSNLYLLPIDRSLAKHSLQPIRYADNFLLLAKNQADNTAAFQQLQAQLKVRHLTLDPASVTIAPESAGFEFMGFWFQSGCRSIAPARLETKRLTLKAICDRHHENLDALIAELSETAKGWRNYYASSEPASNTRPQLQSLQDELTSLLAAWLKTYRSKPTNLRARIDDLRRAILSIELPLPADASQKAKWATSLLAKSKPDKPPKPQLGPQAKRAVAARKKEYQQRKEELQEILITKPGAYLGRTGERLLIRRDGKREAEIPLNLIRNITILTTACSFSGELAAEAANRGISISVLGHDGRPQVTISAPEAPHYHLSLAQASLSSSSQGLELAKSFVLGKIRNQLNLLRYRAKYKERRGAARFFPQWDEIAADMVAIETKLEALKFEGAADISLERNRLMAAEGQAAASYWRAVRQLIWRNVNFQGRVHKGAGDLLNCLLNYGYGILYSRVSAALSRAGLNLNIGFLHTPQPNRPSLVFDFIEEFRAPIVDRTVFALLNLGKNFEINDGALSTDARHDLSRAIVHRLQAPCRYHSETIPLQDILSRQARRLASHIEGKDIYKPFVAPW